MRVARVLFCAALLFTQSLFFDGFVAGTPIKTAAGFASNQFVPNQFVPNTFVPIESLKVGDVVASFDQNNNSLSESIVTATTCIVAAAVFEVEVDGKSFEFLPNTFDSNVFGQLSFDDFERINQLIKDTCVEMFRLQNLNGNNKLENLFSIRIKKGPVDIHLLEVNPDHTFFATEHEILFHNWIASVGFTFAWGAGRALTFTNPFVFIGVTLASIAIDQAIRHSQKHGNTTEEKIFNYMDKLAESYATNSPMPDTKDLDKEKSKESEDKKEEGSSEKKAEKSEEKIKTLDDLLEDSKFSNETSSNTKIYEKEGGFEQANEDFDNMDVSDVRDIPKGKLGKLPDGRYINVRSGSSDKRPTIEVQGPGSKTTKIRYNSD
jgi:hypothetical protein